LNFAVSDIYIPDPQQRVRPSEVTARAVRLRVAFSKYASMTAGSVVTCAGVPSANLAAVVSTTTDRTRQCMTFITC